MPGFFPPVFRIRYILVRVQMRIQILESVPLPDGSDSGSGSGSGSGSCSFRQWPSRGQKNYFLSSSFNAYSLLKVHLHHSSKIKSHKKSQNRRNQGFSSFFCLLMEGSGSVQINYGSGAESRRLKNLPSKLLISSGGINFVTPAANFCDHLPCLFHQILKNFKNKLSFK
jgi:hypothetical protein